MLPFGGPDTNWQDQVRARCAAGFRPSLCPARGVEDSSSALSAAEPLYLEQPCKRNRGPAAAVQYRDISCSIIFTIFSNRRPADGIWPQSRRKNGAINRGEGQMVFPKLPDFSDAQAVSLPFILMPYLIWAFVGDMWIATVEAAASPLMSRSSLD